MTEQQTATAVQALQHIARETQAEAHNLRDTVRNLNELIGIQRSTLGQQQREMQTLNLTIEMQEAQMKQTQAVSQSQLDELVKVKAALATLTSTPDQGTTAPVCNDQCEDRHEY